MSCPAAVVLFLMLLLAHALTQGLRVVIFMHYYILEWPERLDLHLYLLVDLMRIAVQVVLAQLVMVL